MTVHLYIFLETSNFGVSWGGSTCTVYDYCFSVMFKCMSWKCTQIWTKRLAAWKHTRFRSTLSSMRPFTRAWVGKVHAACGITARLYCQPTSWKNMPSVPAAFMWLWLPSNELVFTCLCCGSSLERTTVSCLSLSVFSMYSCIYLFIIWALCFMNMKYIV